MRRLLALSIALSAGASAQVQPQPYAQPQPFAAPAWEPSAAYVTVGQDEPGYRRWYMASAAHRAGAAGFNNYLVTYGVGGIVPTWQLLRTASSWMRCGAQPFEVPPLAEWPNIVQTLRYIKDHVVPAIGPVEAVSAYRNPHLNSCAGGAPESAHKHYSAIDMVPLRPTTREQMMRTLCAVHATRGSPYGVGLGFYAYLRFHVDTTKFRRWGADSGSSTCPPIIRPEDIASVYQQPAPQPSAATPPVTTPPVTPVTAPPVTAPPLAPPVTDPLAPQAAPAPTQPLGQPPTRR
jgi:hypothetical protein